MGVIKNKGIYNILKESIYQIETQCKYDEIEDEIVRKEATRIRERLINLHYPHDSINEAIVEFYKYFSVKQAWNVDVGSK